MIRLFAALSIAEPAAREMMALQKGVLGVTWRPREAFHLTLRFFGDISETQALDVDAELSRVRSRDFSVQPSGVGAFWEGAEAHALWAGYAPCEALSVLAGRCEAAARRAGLKPETRKFTAHTTLAYTRHVEGLAVRRWLSAHALFQAPAFPVRALHLYSSLRGREGSVYQIERTYPLD